MLINQTVENLRRMRLTGMAEAFLAQNQDRVTENAFEERFASWWTRSPLTGRPAAKRLLAGAHLKPRPAWRTSTTGRRGLDRVSWPD